MSTVIVTTVSPGAGDNNAYTATNIVKVFISYLQLTPVLDLSLNVSSVDDDAGGNFGVNFTNAFSASEQQCWTATASATSAGQGGILAADNWGTPTTASLEMQSTNNAGTAGDWHDTAHWVGDIA